MQNILLSIVLLNLLAAALCADGLWHKFKRRYIAIHPEIHPAAHPAQMERSAFDEERASNA